MADETRTQILAKRPDENEEQYIWRVGQAIDKGYIENWRSIVDVLNSTLRGSDEELYRDESAYRKKYQIGKLMYENVFSGMVNDEYAKTIREQIDQLTITKTQFYDQRREYNKLIHKQAREEHLYNELINAAQSLNKEKPIEFDDSFVYSETSREAVIVFADWHYGMVTDNIWNKYDTYVCAERLAEFVVKACDKLDRFEVSKIHVLLLGDLAHGAIHTGVRVASSEDTCDQIMHVAELCSEVVNELSKHAPQTIVYSTYGNHLRTIQNKKESKHSDNMEKLIPWWMQQRLASNSKIKFVEPEFEEFIRAKVCGYNICAVHGDLDNVKNFGMVANTIFTKLYGETIDYTISADKHHLEEFEGFEIENILVRSLCGTDDYARDHRLFSSAGQTLLIFSEEDGREITCNIKFKNNKKPPEERVVI